MKWTNELFPSFRINAINVQFHQGAFESMDPYVIASMAAYEGQFGILRVDGSMPEPAPDRWPGAVNDEELDEKAAALVPGPGAFADALRAAFGSVEARRQEALLTWHAALAHRDTATATAVILGDSLTEGFFCDENRANTYVSRLQQRLRELLPSDTLGSGGGVGYIPATQTAASTDFGARATLTGTAYPITSLSALSLGLGRLYVELHPTGVITWPSVTCTGFDIVYQGAPGGVPCTYTVDGGAPVSFATTASINPDSGVVTQVRGLTAGPHVIAVQGPASLYVNVEGVRFYNGDENAGIQVLNGGHSSAHVYHFYNPADDQGLRPIAHAGAALVGLAFGTNDGNEVAANFGTNLTALIAEIRSYFTALSVRQPSFAIITPYQRAGALASPWADYVAAADAVAAADTGGPLGGSGVHHIALSRQMPPGDDTTQGLMYSDGIHPSVAGHRRIADVIVAELLP